MQQYIIDILMFVITTILGFFLKYVHSQMKHYKSLAENQEKSDIRTLIQQEVGPVLVEIHKLETRLNELEADQRDQIHMIMTLYKFRLIQLCISYIKQGFMTQSQFEELTACYNTYTKKLGGNGQAEEYYRRAISLPIHD